MRSGSLSMSSGVYVHSVVMARPPCVATSNLVCTAPARRGRAAPSPRRTRRPRRRAHLRRPRRPSALGPPAGAVPGSGSASGRTRSSSACRDVLARNRRPARSVFGSWLRLGTVRRAAGLLHRLGVCGRLRRRYGNRRLLGDGSLPCRLGRVCDGRGRPHPRAQRCPRPRSPLGSDRWSAARRRSASDSVRRPRPECRSFCLRQPVRLRGRPCPAAPAAAASWSDHLNQLADLPLLSLLDRRYHPTVSAFDGGLAVRRLGGRSWSPPARRHCRRRSTAGRPPPRTEPVVGSAARPG